MSAADVCCRCQTPPARPHRFFEDYKKNENKLVRVDEILGAEEAIKAVKDGLVGVAGGACTPAHVGWGVGWEGTGHATGGARPAVVDCSRF